MSFAFSLALHNLNLTEKINEITFHANSFRTNFAVAH